MRTIAFVTLVAACGSRQPTEHAAEKVETTPKSGALAAQPEPAKGSGSAAEDAPKGEIVTDQVVAMNSDKYGRPPTDFKKGSVDSIPAPKAKQTATGFEVQFASQATVTTPTVYEREVIVSGGFRANQLFAYEVKTGKPLWGADLHDDGPSNPACESGVCVVNTESCTIFALDAKTGKMLWSYWLGDPLTSAPTIAGDKVFASYPAGGTADGKERPPGATHVLAAFELKTGKIAWQMWLDGDVMSAPVAQKDFVYVTTFGGTVIKAEQKTGKVRYALKSKATSAPVIQFDGGGVEQMYYTRRGEVEADGEAEEMLIRADHNNPETKYKAAAKKAKYIDGKVQAHSAKKAQSQADDAANGFGDGAPASAAAGYAFSSVGVDNVSSMQGFQGSRVLRFADKSINTMGDEVVATDAETGTKLWTFKLSGDTAKQGGFLGTAPAAVADGVLFGTLDGKVVRVEAKTGKSTATYTVGSQIRSQPVTDAGWIYVGTEDGKLVAIDTKDPKVTGWPTWGGNAQRTGVAPVR
jgi:outer membrane protein assembly factor BamB